VRPAAVGIFIFCSGGIMHFLAGPFLFSFARYIEIELLEPRNLKKK